MTANMIWESANEQKELFRQIYRSICNHKEIDNLMTQLKQNIPCLIGVDFDKKALVFRSTDEGITALYVQEKGDTLALAMGTDIKLEKPSVLDTIRADKQKPRQHGEKNDKLKNRDGEEL